MNSLPVPGPSLSTRTEPPCEATRFLTIARPRPSPPAARSSACGCCTNRSNTRSIISGRMPIPWSRTRISTRSPTGFAETRTPVPGSLYFEAFVSRFANTCCSRVGSPSTKRSPGTSSASGCCLSSKQRLRGLGGALDDLGDRRALLVELDLPARDPRDVEQVVDQPHELLELALDDRQLLRASRRADASARRPSRWATRDFAARGPAWPGTRPWRGWRPRPRAVASSARSSSLRRSWASVTCTCTRAISSRAENGLTR